MQPPKIDFLKCSDYILFLLVLVIHRCTTWSTASQTSALKWDHSPHQNWFAPTVMILCMKFESSAWKIIKLSNSSQIQPLYFARFIHGWSSSIKHHPGSRKVKIHYSLSSKFIVNCHRLPSLVISPILDGKFTCHFWGNSHRQTDDMVTPSGHHHTSCLWLSSPSVILQVSVARIGWWTAAAWRTRQSQAVTMGPGSGSW